MRKVNLLGDTGFDDYGRPVAQAAPLAYGGDFLLFDQFSQAALQRAAADDLGKDGMEIIDTDSIWISGDLNFDPGVQVLGEFFLAYSTPFGA